MRGARWSPAATARISSRNGAPRARVPQKLRIQFHSNGAISHRRRIARPRARRHPRRHPGRALTIDLDAITRELRRRQGGYGRGRRMAIESDRAEILSGVRPGETIGGPIAMMIENRDWANWQHTMQRRRPSRRADAGGARRAPVTRPRPGHADLAGVAKYGRDGRARRARARERARNRGARRRRRGRAAAARARRRPADQPRVRDRRRRARRPDRGHVRAAPRPCPDDSPAPLRGCRSRAADDRRDRSPRARPATRWAGRSK